MRYFYAPGSYAATDAAVARIDAPPAPAAASVRVLTSARPYNIATPGTPAGVRRLAELAQEHGHAVRVTFALAEDAEGVLIASLAVRMPGVGFAVYTRRVREASSGWEAGTVILRGRVAGVNELKAHLRGVEYVPLPPKPPAYKVPCQGCGAWVSITGAGKIYSSHKCKVSGTEGRS